MNRYTFKDVATSKRASLAHDIDDDGDEDDEEPGVPGEVRRSNAAVEGEEDTEEKFNDAGEVMEPFNLKDERDGGHFDENMNYVWGKEKAEPDAWLADLDEAAMEKGIGEAAAAQKRKLAAQDEQDSKLASQPRDRESLRRELFSILQNGETVPKALRRLGKRPAGVARAASSDRAIFSRLTEAADGLIVLGVTDVYDLSYDAIDAILSTWEYKGQDGCVHGPFTGMQLVGWMKQGYFGGSTVVQMRKVIIPDMALNPSSEQRGTKRRRFGEQKRDAANDLMQDLEDSDSDEEGTNSRPPAVGQTLTYGPWCLSSDIDFGDVTPDQVEPQPESEEDEKIKLEEDEDD